MWITAFGNYEASKTENHSPTFQKFRVRIQELDFLTSIEESYNDISQREMEAAL